VNAERAPRSGEPLARVLPFRNGWTAGSIAWSAVLLGGLLATAVTVVTLPEPTAAEVAGLSIAAALFIGIFALRMVAIAAGQPSLRARDGRLIWSHDRAIRSFHPSEIQGIDVRHRWGAPRLMAPTVLWLCAEVDGEASEVPIAVYRLFGASVLLEARALADALAVPLRDPEGARLRASANLLRRWPGEGRSWRVAGLLGCSVVPFAALLSGDSRIVLALLVLAAGLALALVLSGRRPLDLP